MKAFTTYSFAGLLVMSSAAIYAQDSSAQTRGDTRSDNQQSDAHVFVGGSYGGFKTRGGEFDDDNDFYEGTIGGFFNSYVGLEGSATYFGEYGNDFVSTDSHGYGIALIGRIPLTETWGLYAKGGQFFWETELDTPAGGADTDGNDPFYGAGMDFRLANSLNMIIEYTRYAIGSDTESIPDTSDTDLDTLKVGLRLRF